MPKRAPGRRAPRARSWSGFETGGSVHVCGLRLFPAHANAGAITVDPGDWVNVCAARYYGLERISGVVVRP